MENILKQLRRRKGEAARGPGGGYSQREAAELCDVSRATWAAWEARNRPISLDQLKNMKKGLELEESEARQVLEWYYPDQVVQMLRQIFYDEADALGAPKARAPSA